jgi:uridine phosphorylase
VIRQLRSEIGTNPVYELDLNGRRVAAFHPGVGAPLAAAFLEEMIALGSRKFMACGGAGVLESAIALGHPIVVSAAVRDEGTSYHYLPPGREVEADPAGVAALEATLRAAHVEYLVGKTWTTDAIYRETPDKIRRRRAEGCLSVEMEAAAFFAVARFRGAHFGQLLYAGDDVGGEAWDSRHWDRHTSVREKLFWLAAEACLRL